MSSIPLVGEYIKDYTTFEEANQAHQGEYNHEIRKLSTGIATSKQNRNIAIGALAIAAIAVVGMAILSGTFLPLAFAAILVIPAVFIYIHHKTMISYEVALKNLQEKGVKPIDHLEYRKDRVEKRTELSNARPEEIKNCGLTVDALIGYRLLDNSSSPALKDKNIAEFYQKVPSLIADLKNNKPDAHKNYDEARLKMYP